MAEFFIVRGVGSGRRAPARRLAAEKQIVLRCGDAGITLTRADEILIHAAYLLSRSSRVNRIQSGSAEIN